MHLVGWTLLILSAVFTPIYSQGQSIFGQSLVELGNNQIMVDKLNAELAELNKNLSVHSAAVYEILIPKYNATVLQNHVLDFILSANDQLKSVDDLTEKLERHEIAINGSLFRQEEQLSKLEKQLPHLGNQWRNQSSELEQLKQLWNDLGEKSVARAAEVKSLEQSIKSLEDRLSQQEAKVDESETATANLGSSLGEATEALESLREDLQESLNTQGRLEGTLVTLKKEINDLRASGVGTSASTDTTTPVDALCKRMTGS